MVVEILDSEKVQHAIAAGADEVIETRRLGFSLLAHAVQNPGTAELVCEVATSGAQSIFVGRLPSDDWSGLAFDELVRNAKAELGALVIGLRDPASGADRLNPPGDQIVDRGSQLIYLAERAVLPPA